MYFTKKEKIFVAMPGVPSEMKQIFKDELSSILKVRFKDYHIIHQTILTFGLGESRLAEELKEWENNLPDFIQLAYLPNFNLVKLRLTAKGRDKNTLNKAIKEAVFSLKPLLKAWYISDKYETLEEVLAELLSKKNLTIATAESCTTGALGKSLSSISGSSAYYKGSIIAYATEIKEQVLKVNPVVIKEKTVVSKEVALEMARGVLDLYSSDLAISSTGVAGPLRGEDNKEVGTLCIAIVNSKFEFSEEIVLNNNNREIFILKAVAIVLSRLRDFILKKSI